ncbi:nucleoside hydrolase [Salmonirosea aquatica]|uniref:Nucleoside hydrolase n=1 Tax=Salmonirosea aquatica TaxID=2654236 RepID=A0A7C9BEP4_9BACT|nr:nucleoside hydrolase [Cytophagaceae bacterium SJW1-29]
MKNAVMVLLCLVPLLSFGQQPVKIILDTDMDSDVDDVGALSMLHSLASAGEADILAVMVSSLNPWSAPAVDVLNTYFGRPGIPIGNVKRFGVYHPSRYARMLAETFPQQVGSGEKAPEATGLYRQILARQPDHSVVIVTIGDLTNVARLLSSAPDTISSLSGEALVAKKVKHLVAMGGRYPVELDAWPNGNFKPDPASTRQVVSQWPTKIIFTGGGVFANAIPTGKIYFESAQEKTPMRRAYETFLVGWNRNYHHSADMIAVYVAVRGPEPYFKIQEQGTNHIFENGTTVWRMEPDDKRHALVNEFAEGVDPLEVARKFDELLIKKGVGK